MLEANEAGLVRKRSRMKGGTITGKKQYSKPVSGENQSVPKHRKERVKDIATRDQIIRSIRANHVCRDLDETETEHIMKAMQYFEFAPGESVVTQGDVGVYFFVVVEGSLEVSTGGKMVNTLGPGTAFGDTALLYDCPRTATVAVSASGPAGLWGTDGDVFRRILREHSKKSLAANREFIEQMCLFDGMSIGEKELVVGLTLIHTTCEAGDRVITENEEPTTVYIVRQGSLSFIRGGSIGASGVLQGGGKFADLRQGDCFGWRGVLYRERHNATVVADEHCELVAISVQQLVEVLGSDFAAGLERSYLLSVLRNMPVMDLLERSQIQQIALAFETQFHEAGEACAKDARIVIVVDGEATGQSASGEAVTMRRGQWCHDEALANLVQDPVGETAGDSKARPAALVGLHEGLVPVGHGCRLATLTKKGLERSLLGMRASGRSNTTQSSLDGDEALWYLRKVVVAKRVPIFKDLSKAQVECLADALELNTYEQGDQVLTQNEVGTSFFIIKSGKALVSIDGQVVRTLGPDAVFGERAVILKERRSATVEITSTEAELWSMEKAVFEGIVPEIMRESLRENLVHQSEHHTLKMLKHVQFIGAGSFGSVRMVEQKRTGVRYALKRIKKEDGVPEEVEQEIKILCQLDHPFMLKLTASFETADSIYMLTELFTGGQLYEVINDELGVLDRYDAQFYVGSIVIMLEALYEQDIIYRDLKPENVMLDSHGYLKLVDFGLAKRLDKDFGRTYTIVGTLFYMAPEVIRGRGYGFECDIWSLGVMFYEFVCGCLPFGEGADDDSEILGDILESDLQFPPRYSDAKGKRLLKGLLEKDSEKRLGVTGDGFEDIRNHKWFQADRGDGDLFSQILGRELEPPIVLNKERFSKKAVKLCTDSDADELGKDDQTDLGCRVLAAFKSIDKNGDGFIEQEELTDILTRLQPKLFTPSAMSAIMKAVDKNGDGVIAYDEFVRWVFQDDDANLLGAFRDAIKLDFH
eukprot:TRINITY_DN27033_c0_g1_i1.p1 TRINITY_DN27033_c0_g1~~TRINITY_DN27033_c0_g1_i1.p1  ORF type:complete len:1057 (-),score=192.34 TRINITY_DN27033_c0_g1_i1:83-3040(-)